MVTSAENDQFVTDKCREAFDLIQGETNEAKINGVLNGVHMYPIYIILHISTSSFIQQKKSL